MKYGQELLDLINYVASLKNENYFFEIYLEIPNGNADIGFRFVSRSFVKDNAVEFPNVHNVLSVKSDKLNYNDVISWIDKQKNELENDLKLYLETKDVVSEIEKLKRSIKVLEALL